MVNVQLRQILSLTRRKQNKGSTSARFLQKCATLNAITVVRKPVEIPCIVYKQRRGRRLTQMAEEGTE